MTEVPSIEVRCPRCPRRFDTIEAVRQHKTRVHDIPTDGGESA